MPRELRSQGSSDMDTRQQDETPETANNKNGETTSSVPVDTLASLDMSDTLRAMLESAQSPGVLPQLYLDLRERLGHVASSILDQEVLNSEAQEFNLDIKKRLEDLRETVFELSKDTSQESSTHEADILALSNRVHELSNSLKTVSKNHSQDNKLASLESSLVTSQAQVSRALDDIKQLQELTKTLTTDNTFLRGRLRELESLVQARDTPVAQEAFNRAADHVSVARSPLVESASQQPRRETPALLPPPVQDHGPQGQVLRPPTYEEFMSGARAPVYATPPRVPTNRGTATNPLNHVAPTLITTCDKLTPVSSTPQPGLHDQVGEPEGPYCPGLVPHVPMLTPFKLVVSYRHYRLKDTRAALGHSEGDALYRVKRRFDSLYPTFTVFTGTLPIKLLEFLTTLREGFDALRVSEAMAALALAYYLDGSAKTHYTALTSPGVRSSHSALGSTWPYLVDSMIKRYLTDDVLQAAYDKITDAKQKADEDENTFADRLVCSARDCCNVFEDRELVNYYIRGLLPSTRDTVTERVRQLSTREQGDITAARRVAQAEGNTYRARREEVTPSTPKAKPRPKIMLVTDTPEELTPTPSPPRRDPKLKHLFGGPEVHWAQLLREDPELASRIATNLESLLFVRQTQDPKTRALPTSPTSTTSLDELINRAHLEVPKLTPEQYRDALTVIPADYWSLNCWTCKTDGHITFTCPCLTPEQRLYFAYCYFLYQCKGNPTMKGWLRERHNKRWAKVQDHESFRRDTRPDRDTRYPRSPGGNSRSGKPYQNRQSRNSDKNVRFDNQGQVMLTTQVDQAPQEPTWRDKRDSDSSDSGNEKGQE